MSTPAMPAPMHVLVDEVTPPAPQVAVTGLGAVTPIGVGVEAFGAGLRKGLPATRRLGWDVPVDLACPVDDLDAPGRLGRKLVRQLDRSAVHGLVAAHEALADAGLLGDDLHVRDVDPARTSVVMGNGVGSVVALLDEQERLESRGADRVRPYLAVAVPPNMIAGQTAIRHGIKGPCSVVATACAAGSDAIGQGLALIRSGQADVVVAGGAEAPIVPVVLASFAAAGALSHRMDDPASASRPFDRDRDGFVLGEGAGVVVLERLDHARTRGAPVHALLAGYGASTDAHHATQPAPGGEGAARAIASALSSAGLDPEQVDHVNAHGTSTPANDAAEADALHAALGARARQVPVTSTKSMTGHLFGAAGAIEAVATVLAVRDGLVHATASTTDVAVDLDVVVGSAREMEVRTAISTSLGFGGHNAALVFTSA